MYSAMTLDEMKQKRVELIETDDGDEIETNQLVGLDLVIVTVERNPNYKYMYEESAEKKRLKKERKGAFVKAEKIHE